MRRICLVSEECNGVAEGGGIGACVRGLAELMTSTGCKVDLLITRLTPASVSGAERDFGFVDRVFFLMEVVKEDSAVTDPVDEPSKSYCVYRFLRGKDYTEIHFNDWLGTGFYTAMARSQGLFGARVVTHLHGSSEWVRAFNLNPPALEDLEVERIERSQIENSDLAISPSRYLLDWYAQRGVALPAHVQRPWILPQWHVPPLNRREDRLATRPIAAGVVDQIVYFGRHERRKGFDLFVDAVASLPPEVQPDIAFVGRFDRIAQENTGALALRKLAAYGGRIRFYHDLSQKEALALLGRARGSIGVMPSRIENSPCVIGECFTLGLPFLATDVGGTAELIDEASRAHCLVKPNPKALAQAILRVIAQGMPSLVSTLSPLAILEDWRRADFPAASRRPRPAATPLVSVCLTHYERPRLLARAYRSILAQSYANIEIVIVDDGSASEAAHAYLDELERSPGPLPVTILRSENKFLGAARNLAARHARGDYLLFHDDDNFAEPDEVATFVSAALHSDADVLTAQCYVFQEEELGERSAGKRIEFYPLGLGGAFSFFRNRFGDANALIRRSVFERIGGFTEERDLGWEDWEFFLKAHIAGCRMGVVPEPLFNYRVSGTGMLSTGDPLLNFERLYAAVDALRPNVGADMLRFANGRLLFAQIQDRTRYRLSRESGSALHHKLMDIEPNTEDAIVLLSDLAFAIGRFEDAVEIGAKIFDQREKLLFLLQTSSSPGRRVKHRPFELSVAAPTEQPDGLLAEGWFISEKGAPLDLQTIFVAGRAFRVVAVRRCARPDVQKANRLSSAADLGFLIYAVAGDGPWPKGAARQSRLKDGLPSVAGLQQKWASKLSPGASFVFDDIACNLPAVRGSRGHIDRVSWSQELEIALPDDLSLPVTMDIETAVAAETAVVWGDGEIDPGAKISPSRRKFVLSELEKGRETPIRAIVPAATRTHVLLM